MSDQMIKNVIAGALALHGLGHGGALGALIWIGGLIGDHSGGWQAARSWLAAGLPAGTATTVAWRQVKPGSKLYQWKQQEGLSGSRTR